MGGIDGILMTQWLQKHWERYENWRKNVWHGSEKRPAMYVASVDIKTALDVARPQHIARVLERDKMSLDG